MIKKYGIITCIFIIAAVLIYFSPGKITVPVEKMDILAGVASDLSEDKKHIMTISNYTFNKKDEVSSMILYAKGNTISEARAERQLKDNRKYLSALEKVMIFGEDLARSGIKDDVDITFGNPFMNDMGWAIVCSGKGKDMLSKTINGYPSSADYIDGLIENSKEANYFSDNYKLMDVYVRIEQE